MTDITVLTNQIIHELENEIEAYKNNQASLHPYDYSQLLQKLRTSKFDAYVTLLKKIPSDLLASIIAEMPILIQEEVSKYVSIKKLANVTGNMDSDDASTFIQNIGNKNEQVAKEILNKLDEENKELIEQLISYEKNQVGSYMQVELFSAKLTLSIGEAIKNLKEKKEAGVLNNISHCHIMDTKGKYVGSLALEELIIIDDHIIFHEIPSEKLKTFSINHKYDISKAIELFTKYNLTTLPVVDDRDRLIGKITYDDIYDIIIQKDTQQLYELAGVSEKKEQVESLYQIGTSRAFWLGINLITAILASLVIGIFDTTIQSLVALAVLMPIVASMGGNAGTQTLTVTVRQMALGDISLEDAKKTINKEVIISLVNGTLFAIVMGIIAYLWFSMPLLGVVIAISMVLNLLSAGFFGAIIPLGLQKLNIDPAVASTVIVPQNVKTTF